LKAGIAENTIGPEIKNLKRINKFCNITEPEEVKTFIAISKYKNSYKQLLAIHYDNYLKFKSLKWVMPTYKREETLQFIPLETEIDLIIAACAKRIATLL